MCYSVACGNFLAARAGRRCTQQYGDVAENNCPMLVVKTSSYIPLDPVPASSDPTDDVATFVLVGLLPYG